MLPLIEISPRRLRIYGPLTLFRAKKDGGLFLRGEKTTLWDINGFMIQTRKHRLVIIFKRSELDRALRARNRR